MIKIICNTIFNASEIEGLKLNQEHIVYYLLNGNDKYMEFRDDEEIIYFEDDNTLKIPEIIYGNKVSIHLYKKPSNSNKTIIKVNSGIHRKMYKDLIEKVSEVLHEYKLATFEDRFLFHRNVINFYKNSGRQVSLGGKTCYFINNKLTQKFLYKDEDDNIPIIIFETSNHFKGSTFSNKVKNLLNIIEGSDYSLLGISSKLCRSKINYEIDWKTSSICVGNTKNFYVKINVYRLEIGRGLEGILKKSNHLKIEDILICLIEHGSSLAYKFDIIKSDKDKRILTILSNLEDTECLNMNLFSDEEEYGGNYYLDILKIIASLSMTDGKEYVYNSYNIRHITSFGVKIIFNGIYVEFEKNEKLLCRTRLSRITV